MTVRRPALVLALIASLAVPLDAGRASTTIPGLQNPAVVGAASLSFFGFTVYRGRLFTEAGRDFAPGEPVALEIIYNRNFSAQQMLSTTRSELARVEPDAPDRDALANRLAECFADVGRGDQFLAASEDPDRLRLWLNGRETCNVSGDRIGERFLSIWLSENSRFPNLSRQLRGG